MQFQIFPSYTPLTINLEKTVSPREGTADTPSVFRSSVVRVETS